MSTTIAFFFGLGVGMTIVTVFVLMFVPAVIERRRRKLK